MKKIALLLGCLAIMSCYELSERHEIDSKVITKTFVIPPVKERIILNGTWSSDSSIHVIAFGDTTYKYISNGKTQPILMNSGYYYVSRKDTMLHLCSSNIGAYYSYKLLLYTDSLSILTSETLITTFYKN